MRRLVAIWVVLAIGCLAAPAVLGQTEAPRVQAYVQPAADITDVTQIRLVLEVSGLQNPRVQPPNISGLSNLRLLSRGPSVEQSTRFVNGQVSSSYRLSYVLVPEQVGTARVPGFDLVVNGKTYKTDPIQFEVIDSPKGPSGGSAADGTTEVVFAKARLSKDEVWVGEPVMVGAYVYSALRVNDTGLAERPAYPQFLASEVGVDPFAEATRAEIGGRTYIVYPVRRDLLIPLGPGSYEIDPFTIQVQVQSRRDAFDLFARGTNVLRKTDPIRLRVKALPRTAPSGFGGAVGEFALSASLDRETAAVNDAVALKIVVEGSGSLQTVEPPQWDAPPGVKVYDPESSLEVDLRNGTLYSKKSWEWVLVPLAPGDVKLDGLSFVYFDPQEGAYRTRKSDALQLSVAEGDGLPSAAPSAADRSVISLEQRDIGFIKPLRGDPLRYPTPPVHQRWWFASLTFAPLLWAPFLIWLGRQRDLLQRDRGLARGRRARRRAKKALAAIRKNIDQTGGAQFHEEVARTLVAYVGDRFNRSPSGLTYELADELLATRGIDDTVRRRFRACLETCDFARFVPASAEAGRRTEVLDEAVALIDVLERAW